MSFEPLRSSVSRVQVARQRNPYEGRWNWWYSSIADEMIANPGTSIKDIAAKLGKHGNTISMIVNTDMFQEFLAQRKDEWRRRHDFALLSKVTEVAELAMESVAEQFRKKKDQVPLALAVETMTSALDRLGYAPKTQPVVQVNNQVNEGARTVIVQGVSTSALEEARQALRLAEQRRAQVEYQSSSPPFVEASGDLEPTGASDNGAEDDSWRTEVTG